MWPSHHLTGTKIGRWLVGERVGTKNGFAYLECVCECGTKRAVVSQSLVNGNSVSCGCWSKEYKRDRYTTHGLKRHPLYYIWQGMKTRCYNTKAFGYKDYGGRGITVCEKWIKDFKAFYDDMSSTYEKGLTIERKDVNKGYSPDNCTWITRSEQGKNKRNTATVETIKGRMTIVEAAKLAGITPLALKHRINRNWPIENLLAPRSHRS